MSDYVTSASDEQVAVTAAAASLLTTLTLAPLVQGLTWLFVAGITVVTVMVTGIVARQLLRWWPAVAGVQAVVLGCTLLLLFARSRVLEGPAAIGALVDLLRDGFDVTQSQAPPVEASQGIVLMVAGSAGLIALLVDLLAASLRQPALAGLPLLAVYCVPAALLEGGLPWYYFFLAAAGFLLLLSADAGDRIRGWGRVLTSSSSSRGPGADSGLARGGRRIGVAAVLVAVVLPGLVPGLNNQIIGGTGEGDGTGKGRTVTRINPILDMRNDLTDTKDTPVISYRTDVADPEPLRIVTADEFDGNTWSPNTLSIPSGQRVQDGLTAPLGLGPTVPVTTANTRISVLGLRETYLPLPYPTRRVQIEGTWLFDKETLNVISGERQQTTAGVTYTAQSWNVRPNASQLADAPAPAVAGSLLAKYLALPSNLPSQITNTAAQVAGSGTDYQQAIRLQNWLRQEGGFTYSTKAPDPKSGAGGSDAIIDFLRTKRGYCVHFASTMAVMARTLGIPARVAVGFLPGDLQADGQTRIISTHDAHAWPELYFEGVGWTRFEPTPRSDSSATTTPPAWAVPPANTFPNETGTASATASDPADAAPGATATRPTRQLDEGATPQSNAGSGFQVPWRGVLVALLVLLGLASPRLAASYGARRRWRRALSTAGLAEAAWDDLRLGLSDLGVRWAAAWTPRAVGQRLALSPAGQAALQRLVAEIETARYAPPDDTLGRPAGERIDDVAAVLAEISSTLPPRRRWLIRIWPPSGVAALTTFGGWISATADRTGQQAGALGTQVREKVTSSRK